ncbi:transporter substrate-binding domain-containing protein [Pseudoalteromonas ostreae]
MRMFFMKPHYVIFFLLFSNSLFADSLRIALPEQDYPPYHFVCSKKGILNDVLTSFSMATGIQIDYTFVPEMRSAKMVKQGDVDARMESEIWLVDDGPYYWSQEIVVIEDVLVIARGAELIDFKELDNLKGGVLLGRFGYVYPKYELPVKSRALHRENFYSDLEILQSLYKDTDTSKRFTVMSRSVVNWYIKKNPELAILTISDVNVGKAPLQLQFSFNTRGKKYAKEFNDFLQSLKDNGGLAKIIARYQ